MSYQPSNTLQSYIAPNIVFPEQLPELLVKLTEVYKNIADAVNIRELAQYQNIEVVTGQQFFSANIQSYRQTLRKVTNFGALPNTATKSVAHGLTVDARFTITRLYGAASDTTGFTYIPVPSAQADLTMDATNFNITTTANLTNYNVCYVIVEYLRN